MAHAHDEFDGAVFSGNVKHLIDSSQQRCVAFQRKSLVAEIALLQSLLEEVGAHEEIEGAFLVDGGWFGLDVFLNPAATLWVGDVRELDANAATINTAGFTSPCVIDL